MFVSHTDICADVSYGMYATRHGLNEEQLSHLWTNLGIFVASCLRCGKGAVLPGLGTFYAAAQSQYKQSECVPSFVLQERTFRGVSQEAPRAARKGTTPQLNYNAIGQNVPLHRAAVQRLVRELLSKLASNILSNDIMQVELPHVGTFIRRRGGRFRFQFSPALLAYLNGDTCSNKVPQPLAAHPTAHQLPPSIAPTSPAPNHFSDPVNQHSPAYAVTTPRGSGIASLRALCAATDSSRTGNVTRLQMERWLNRDCRALVNQLPGTALLDLLHTHSHGRQGTYVEYAPLINTLEAQLARLRAAEAAESRPGANGIMPQSSAMFPAARSSSPRPSHMFQAPHQWPGASAHSGSPAVPDPATADGPRSPAPQDIGHHRRSSAGDLACAQSVLSDMAAMAPGLADQEPFPYLLQSEFVPRNRRECDDFNRFHFERLRAVRGERGLTPKVGRDPLTDYEVHYARQVQRNRSPSPAGERQHTPDAERYGVPASPPPPMHTQRPSTAWPASPSRHRFGASSPTRAQHDHAGVWPQAPTSLPEHSVSLHPHTQPGLHRPATAAGAGPLARAGKQQVGWLGGHSAAGGGGALAEAPGHSLPHGTAAPHGYAVHPHPPGAAAWPLQQQHASEAPTGRAQAHSSPGSLAGHLPAGSRGASLTFHPHQQPPSGLPSRGPSPAPQQSGPAAAAAAAPPFQRLVRSTTPSDEDASIAGAAAGHLYGGWPAQSGGFGGGRPGTGLAGSVAVGDENVRPGSRATGLDKLHVRSTRDPSPVKDILRWDHADGPAGACTGVSRGATPATSAPPAPPPSTSAAASAAAAAKVGDAEAAWRRRSDAAASLRQSYSQQIEEREALREQYAAAEAKWPYQPIHHPEARFPYFNGPRYVRPHFVSSPAQL